MSKTTWVVIIVITLTIAGYFVFSGNKEANVPAGEEQSAQTPERKMAFADFVRQGGSYKCEVKQALSDMENSGTVYLSGGMMRGEFRTVAEGRTVTTNIINRDGYTYTWSSASPETGFKIKVDASADAETSGTYSWDASQVGDYNCAAWSADASVFAVPTSVTFQELEPK